MKGHSEKTFTIVPVNSTETYDGLRSLWCEVFGDSPEYVDAFYDNFGDDITGYVVLDDKGEVCSALTCHLCGEYKGRPVYASYAICTREDMRGQGIASELTSFVRDEVTAAGGISVLSPAEPSLISFYSALGYEPHFFVDERAVMSPEFDFEEYDDFDEFDLDIEGADPTPFRAEIDLQQLTAEKYNKYREAFLSGQAHIEPSCAMLRLIEAESMNGCGLYSINRGDAICAVSHVDPAKVVAAELVLNPILKELSMDIDTEIASMIAKHFGAVETEFITPGQGGCQGMIYGLPPQDEMQAEEEYEVSYDKPYYGFPIP
jgi:GNAT superfamily N-acetyltransferase